MGTIVYIDGFNFYYGAVKGTAHKWLDLQAEAGVRVGIINPHPAKYRSRRLQGTFFKQLRPNVLGQCQLPTTIQDGEGAITKPSTW